VGCTTDPADVSGSEQRKADKEGRTPVARSLASSGGFVLIEGVKVSYNVIV
jgi:hypothetical protein